MVIRTSDRSVEGAVSEHCLYKRGAAGLKVKETEQTRTTDALSRDSSHRRLAPGPSPYWLSPTRKPPPKGTGWDPTGQAPRMRVCEDRQINGLEGRTEDTCHRGEHGRQVEAGAIFVTVLGYDSEVGGTVSF